MERGRDLGSLNFAGLGLDPAPRKLEGVFASPLVLSESDPQKFLFAFFEALLSRRTIWLASPDWGSARKKDLERLMKDWGERAPGSSILIPTGGTSGRLRYAVHSWDSLRNSAEAFARFFSFETGVHSVCVLPFWHVSGLMQAVRVAVCGGRLVLGDPHDPSRGLPDDFEPESYMLSIVPTQLRRLIDTGHADWLRRFRLILIGGAAMDSILWQIAREAKLPISPSYGMTESAAVVCALRPEEFLSGKTGAGRPLPHASLHIEDADTGDISYHPTGLGRVRVRANSLCRALVPGVETNIAEGILTGDTGWIDADGILHITGRADRVIVSGAQKIEPAEVENVMIHSGLVSEAFVIGVPDREWGHAVAAFYVPESADGDIVEQLSEAIRECLSPVHVPKKWVALEAIPRTAAGKTDSSALLEMLQ